MTLRSLLINPKKFRERHERTKTLFAKVTLPRSSKTIDRTKLEQLPIDSYSE